MPSATWPVCSGGRPCESASTAPIDLTALAELTDPTGPSGPIALIQQVLTDVVIDLSPAGTVDSVAVTLILAWMTMANGPGDGTDRRSVPVEVQHPNDTAGRVVTVTVGGPTQPVHPTR